MSADAPPPTREKEARDGILKEVPAQARKKRKEKNYRTALVVRGTCRETSRPDEATEQCTVMVMAAADRRKT